MGQHVGQTSLSHDGLDRRDEADSFFQNLEPMSISLEDVALQVMRNTEDNINCGAQVPTTQVVKACCGSGQ